MLLCKICKFNFQESNDQDDSQIYPTNFLELGLDFSDDGEDDSNFEIPLANVLGAPAESDPGGSADASTSNNGGGEVEVDDLIVVDTTTSQRGGIHAIFNGFRQVT